LEEVRKLAEQGDAEAQWLMGSYYRNGEGVSPGRCSGSKMVLNEPPIRGNVNAQSAMGAAFTGRDAEFPKI